MSVDWMRQQLCSSVCYLWRNRLEEHMAYRDSKLRYTYLVSQADRHGRHFDPWLLQSSISCVVSLMLLESFRSRPLVNPPGADPSPYATALD